MTTSTLTAAGELVPLADRLRYMVAFRVGAVAIVLVLGVFVPDLAAASIGALAAGTALYVLVSAIGVATWSARRSRGLLLFGVLLLVDGVWLAWVSYVTGGTVGPLRFLVLIHLVTVALLASYTTSLKLAMWHSLLLLITYFAQEANIIVPPDESLIVRLPGSELERLSVFMGSFWLVAIVTASFSAVNERELRRRRFDLEALARLATELEEATSSVTVGEVLLSRLEDAFGFPRALLLQAPNGHFQPLAWQGDEHPPPVPPLDQPGSLLARVVERRRTLLVSLVDAEYDPWIVEALPGARNVVLVPLSSEGRTIGVLVLEHGLRSGSRIERRVVSMVERFASHAALALRNAWLLEEVQERAATDGLTGIANRRTLELTLERELSRARREGSALSLVIFDLDRFKQLNDDHGHQTGDAVLREVADLLTGQCREFDTAARYGGEEFAIVLPNCDLVESLEISERLRQLIAEADTTVPVTTSGGVATYPDHGRDVQALVKAADDALYESKHAGRNRVTRSRRHLSNPPPAPVQPLHAKPATDDSGERHLAG